jgi:hypothetical protein
MILLKGSKMPNLQIQRYIHYQFEGVGIRLCSSKVSKPQNSQVKMTAATTEAMELAPTVFKVFVNKISEETSRMLKKVATIHIQMFRPCG